MFTPEENLELALRRKEKASKAVQTAGTNQERGMARRELRKATRAVQLARSNVTAAKRRRLRAERRRWSR